MSILGTIKTQWGFEDEFGPRPTEDYTIARTIVDNMNKAGRPAKIVWRGVTAWFEDDEDE